jgi:hypothetical protein
MTSDRLFSYKMTDDAGFAPNPWWGYLTLATCKPKMREKKVPGDWVAGFTSGALCGHTVGAERLVFLMRVSEKMPIAAYYWEKHFERKIPRPESKDLRLRLGDNIYKPLKECPQTDDDFVQMDDYCHGPNEKHHDLSGKYVLVAKKFVYFGRNAIVIPEAVRPDVPPGQSAHGSQTRDNARALDFIKYVTQRAGLRGAVLGAPHSWPQGAEGWQNRQVICSAPRKKVPSELRAAVPSQRKPRC